MIPKFRAWDREKDRMKAVALVEFTEAYKSGELISRTK